MYEPTAKDYAAIYARVSNPTQDTSILSQIQIGKETLEKEKLLLYDVYSDKETVTKFDPIHREGFKRLLYDAMNDKFKTVIVFKRDRLARMNKDSSQIKDVFKKYNIKIIYSNDGEFQPRDGYQSNFVENLLGAVDELEPKTIQERAVMGIKKKRERGEYSSGNNCPYGYMKNLENKKVYVPDSPDEKKEYEPDPAIAPIIKMIFTKYMNIDTRTYKKADLLKEINNIKKDLNLDFTITNPIYAGLYLPDSKDSVLNYVYKDEYGNFQVDETPFKEWVNVHPILTKDCWFEALKHYSLITKHKTKIEEDKKNYLFKHLLVCKECNRKLYLNGNRYRCSKGCTNISYSILVDTLLEQILNDILEKDLKNYYERKLKEIQTNISQLDKNLKTNKLDQRKILVEMIKKEDLDEESLNKYTVKEKELLNELNILKEKAINLIKISEVFNTIACLSRISELQNYIKRNTVVSQIFLSSIIEVITLSGKSKCTVGKSKYAR